MAEQQIVIKRDPDGRRYVQPYLGVSKVTGRAIRPYKSFPADMTDEEVTEAARRWLVQVGKARSMGTACKVGELLEVYVDMVESSGGAANTVRNYRRWARTYLRPLHALYATDVTPWMVERLYSDLVAAGGRTGGPLSARTVRSVAWFLSGAFRWLVQVGVCESNPCESTHVPMPDPVEALALDEGAMGSIVPALRQEMAADARTRAAMLRRCSAFLAWMALHTGVRAGEACALRRGDVNVRGHLHVCGTVTEVGEVRRSPTTKSRRFRNVSLSPALRGEIAAHVAWEDEVLGVGGRSGLSGMPLATVDGGWLRPSVVSREFRAIARDHGLPAEARFHTLRHTHATWLLLGGADMKTVSERMGHADVATTMRIYGHVLPGRDQAAADMFEDTARRFSRRDGSEG